VLRVRDGGVTFIKDGYSDPEACGMCDAGIHEVRVMRDQTPNPEHDEAVAREAGVVEGRR